MWSIPITILYFSYWTTLIFLQCAKWDFILIVIVKIMSRWWQVINFSCYRPCIEKSFCWTKIFNQLRMLLWEIGGICSRSRSILMNKLDGVFLILPLMIFHNELFKPIFFLFSFLGFRLTKNTITVWIVLISIKKAI